MLVFKSAATATASGLQKLRRDPLLDGDNGGVTFAFDLGFTYSWVGGSPTNGALIRDTAEVADGSFVATGTGTVLAGNGFDFTAPITNRAYVEGPAGCLASIWAGNQYFMVTGWYKMPTSLTWFSTPGNYAPIFQCAVTSYAAGPELVVIGQTSVPRLDFRRQTNGSTFAGGNNDPTGNIFGQVAQVAYWRNASGVGMRTRSALGQVLITSAVGANNVGDFSAMKPKWGVPPAATVTTNMRLYRGAIENLQVSGRDPVAVLDADFAATIARGVFS